MATLQLDTARWSEALLTWTAPLQTARRLGEFHRLPNTIPASQRTVDSVGNFIAAALSDWFAQLTHAQKFVLFLDAGPALLYEKPQHRESLLDSWKQQPAIGGPCDEYLSLAVSELDHQVDSMNLPRRDTLFGSLRALFENEKDAKTAMAIIKKTVESRLAAFEVLRQQQRHHMQEFPIDSLIQRKFSLGNIPQELSTVQRKKE